MTTPPINEAVSRRIAATPEAVYDLVADVTRMGEWSPETTSADWLDGVDAAAPGARFTGKNQLGFLSWSTKPTVLTAERGREFSFEVPGKGGPVWTYRFTPSGDDTIVTESVVQSERSPLPLRFLQRLGGASDRAASLRTGMTEPLERLAATAETRVSA